MPAFPTDITPQSVTGFDMPGSLSARSHGGVLNFRDSTAVGRSWSMTYFSDVTSANFKKLMTIVRQYHREGTTFTVQHPDYLTPTGAVAGGTPVVQGGSQTGSSLIIDGASNSITGWLKAGDLFTMTGINHAFEVTADVTSTGSGTVTLPISPSIYSGGSPADNATLVVTGVTINSYVDSYDMPTTNANNYGRLRVTFVEKV